MRKYSRGLLLSAVLTMQAAILMPLGTVPAANAVLNPPAQVVAPVEPAPHLTNGGFPLFYQDRTGLALSLCIDQNGSCALPGPAAVADPATGVLVGPFGPGALVLPVPPGGVQQILTAAPLSSASFPIEAFYWLADSGASKTVLQADPALGATTPGGKFRINFSLSGGFATLPFANVVEGQQTAMLRADIFKMLSGLIPHAVYTITTPVGTITLPADAAGGFSGGLGGQGYRAVIVGGPQGFNTVTPGVIPASTNGNGGSATALTLDNFLVCQTPQTPPYIGSPLLGCTAEFANDPTHTQQNVVITGPGLPAAGVTVSSWSITGKQFGMSANPGGTDFGATAIVTPTPAAPVTGQTFTITNINPVSTMTIGAITLAGPNATDFVIIPTPTPAPAVTPCATGAVLPAAVAGTPSNCTVTVAFAPKALAPAPEVAIRTASVNIAATFSPVAPAVTPTTVPPGIIALKGTAQYSMSATAASNGTISPAGAAIAVNAGSSPSFTIQPNAKFQVKDITVNGALAHFTPPVKPGDPVTFAVPAATANGTAVSATFMPSGDLDGNGTLDSADALKALKILVGLQAPVGDDAVAMKVAPLDATGRPNPTAGAAPDLNDVVLILKRALNIITW